MTTSSAPARSTLYGELALAATTVATVVSLLRLFDPGPWLPVLIGEAAAAHAVAATGRRLGWRLGRATAALVACAAATVIVVHGGGSPAQVGRSVTQAFADFSDVRAPVPAHDGFVAACSAAVWLIAALADWWSFRLRATVEAVIPAGALFVIATVLGADTQRALFAGTFIATVLVHVLAGRRARAEGSPWIGVADGRGPGSVVKLGVGIVATAVSAAVIVGPRLPSATAEGAVDLTDLDGDSPAPREVRPPIVDVKRQQVQLSDVVMFQVRSDVDAYWRLTSLERFDGRRWESSGSYGKADGDLDDGVPVDAERTVIDTDFRILDLGQVWAPAAYEPIAATSSEELRYDETSGTLIVGSERNTSDGVTYSVTSALPVLDPAALASASREIPAPIAEENLGLPPDFPVEIVELARQVTAGARSAYEQAILLQSFFRSEFAYSLDVEDSHSTGTMMNFLFENRVGYCEQFAATFAAMARSLGIPSRVAVGFTPGERSAGDPEVLNVRGLNAHAWPEVFLGQYGWVAFEPTPGRGNPTAEAYTGVPAQQAEPTEAPTVTATAPPSTIPSELTTPPTSVVDTGVEAEAPDAVTAARSSPNPWPRRVALALSVLAGAVGVYAGAIWSFDRLRILRRRRRASSETARIAAAWDEAVGAVHSVGIPMGVGETHAETAGRVRDRLPVVGTAFTELATAVESATFSPRTPAPGSGENAFRLADEVRVGADGTRDLAERLRHKYDPRRRLRRWRS